MLKLEELPWVKDGITESEMELISYLSNVADTHFEIADSEITAPEATGELIKTVLSKLVSIRNEHESKHEQLLSQPWFRDGLTDEEAALIVVLPTIDYHEDIFQGLIGGGHVVSDTISLPMAGEVTLYAVSRSLFQQDYDVLGAMRTGIRVIEEFMGRPWNNSSVIALVEPEWVPDVSGAYAVTHIVLKSPDRHTIYHELAHYYLTITGSKWLNEGGSEFLSRYTQDVTEEDPRSRLSYRRIRLQLQQHKFLVCVSHGVSNIQDWIDAPSENKSQGGPLKLCHYPVGELYLLEMYESLGHDVVRASLRQLYDLGTSRGRVSEDDIYQTFLSNTPEAKQDEFRNLYSCLHGRSISSYTPEDRVTPTHVRDALAALYNATNGPGWTNNEQGLSQAPLGQWPGILTDCDGDVIVLDLNSYGLTGTIPPQLGGLSKLEWLLLPNNQLSGTIPPELGNLSSLTYLDLSQNQLTGAIPSELGKLSKLRELRLHNNQLSGTMPPELGSLSKLDALRLYNNQLTGPIPPELGGLSKLKWLFMTDNQLTGTIPAELGSLSNLQDLDFSKNQLTGAIPAELGSLSNLQDLDLSENLLTGPIPPELGSLPKMGDLRLYNNQLTGPIPPELGSLSNLKWLLMTDNQLTGTIPAELGSLSSLERMTLSANQLTGPIPPELGNLLNLKQLTLSANQLTGPIPPELGNLSNLEELFLSAQLTGSIPAELGRLSSLTRLILGGNQLTGPIPAEFGNLSNLELLYLPSNGLTGPIPPELGNLFGLTGLFLHNNHLTGPIPPELGNLFGLIGLSLNNNQLTGPIPPELGSLSSLIRLYVAGNQLTGCIPAELRSVPINDFADANRPFC